MEILREQGTRLESSLNTRQDRNAFLTGGGTLEWDGGTGSLTWSSDLILYMGALGTPVTIAAGSISGVTPEPECIYVLVDRSAGGIVTTAHASIHDTDLDVDNAIVLAVRGPNSRLHFMDGTVLEDGESGALGAPSPSIGRSVVVSTGVATVLVGFDYLGGTNQLMVIVGGIVQELTTHYTETADSPGEIEFVTGFIPLTGERIVFLALNGGQGAPGPSATRQNAYDSGRTVDVTSGLPLRNRAPSPSDTVEQWGTPADPDLARMRADGKFRAVALRTSDDSNPGYFWEAITFDGNLVFWNNDTEKAVVIDRTYGGMQLAEFDGTTLSVIEDGPVGPVYVEVGALSSVGVTTVSWTRGVKGLLVLAYNDTPAIQAWSAVEQSGLSSAGNELYAFFDESIPAIILCGDLAGTQPVGVNYRGNACRLVVFT